MLLSRLLPRAERCLVLAGGLASLIGCGGSSEAPGAEDGSAKTGAESTPAPSGEADRRAARLRGDLAAWTEVRRRIESAGASSTTLEALGELLAASAPTDKWLELEGWALTRPFVEAYLAWNEPLGGEPAYRSLDFTDPEHAYHHVTRYARTLEENGVDFLLVVVPTRLHIYPDRMPGREGSDPFPGEGPGDVSFLRALVEAGVEVLDLWTPFCEARHGNAPEQDQLLHHDYDVHWTPRGVGLAADLIAERIRQYPWFEQGDHFPGEGMTLVRERKLWSYEGSTYPGYEPVEVVFDRVLGVDGEAARIKDRESPILVMGDSFVQYARREGASLLHLLLARLGHRLDVILAKGGRGIEWVTLDRRRDNLAGKRLVVWTVSASLFADHGLKDVPLFRD